MVSRTASSPSRPSGSAAVIRPQRQGEHERAAQVAEGEAPCRHAVAVRQLRDVGEVGVVDQDRRPVRHVRHHEGQHTEQRRTHRHQCQPDGGRGADRGADDQHLPLGGRAVRQRPEQRQHQDLQDHREADGVREHRRSPRLQPEQGDPAVVSRGRLRDRRQERPPDGRDHGRDEGGVGDVVQREADTARRRASACGPGACGPASGRTVTAAPRTGGASVPRTSSLPLHGHRDLRSPTWPSRCLLRQTPACTLSVGCSCTSSLVFINARGRVGRGRSCVSDSSTPGSRTVRAPPVLKETATWLRVL
jgi:hypothetical protein